MIKVPLLQPLEITQFEPENLKNVFKRNHVGHYPYLITPIGENFLKAANYIEAIKSCQAVFTLMGLSPNFPYPTYVTSHPQLNQNFFPEVESLEKAPRHFVKKIKKVKKREQGLLSRAETLSSRIEHHDLAAIEQYLQKRAQQNKELRDLTYENHFYQKLLDQIRNPEINDPTVE